MISRQCPGDTPITGKDGAPMVLVPAGEFLYRRKRDSQQVSLPVFYIDTYEVTTAQYAKFMATTRTEEPEYWQASVSISNGRKPVGQRKPGAGARPRLRPRREPVPGGKLMPAQT